MYAFANLLGRYEPRAKILARQQGQSSHPASAYMRPVASAPNLTAVNGPPFGGAFLRLEQDWRETHMAYLQHRSAVCLLFWKKNISGLFTFLGHLQPRRKIR